MKTPAEIKREIRTIRRMRGRCTECKRHAAPGMARCDTHLEQGRERSKRFRDKTTTEAKAMPRQGEKNHRARLTGEQVAEIRRIRLATDQRSFRGDDPRSLKSLAARFGVSASQIGKVALGRQWRHLGGGAC